MVEPKTDTVNGKKAEEQLQNAPKTVSATEMIQKRVAEVMHWLPKEEQIRVATSLCSMMIESSRVDSRLASCTFESKMKALLACAITGLTPFTPMGECYIIPYGNEANFQYGYKGLMKMFTNLDIYQNMVWADVVRKNDSFKILAGSDPKLIHEYLIIDGRLATIEERGEINFFYGVFKTQTATHFEVMALGDMLKHRDRYSKTNLKDPNAVWNKEPEAMGEKTMIIKVLKFAPKSPKLIQHGINLLTLDETVKRELAAEPADFTDDMDKAFQDHRRQDVEGDLKPKKEPEKGKGKGAKPGKVTGDQWSAFWGLCHKVKYPISVEQLQKNIAEKYKVKKYTDINSDQYKEELAIISTFNNKEAVKPSGVGTKEEAEKRAAQILKEADKQTAVQKELNLSDDEKKAAGV